jgi:predicted short-subunit dehydrogenase-like oxidoreductase (DUF2520 family)
MRVAIVGPGRVGTLLAVAFARAGHRVVAVAGGDAAARDRIAGLVAGVRPTPELATAIDGADLVVLAVPDDAIATLIADLARIDALAAGQRLVHVAGSHGLAPLRLAAAAGARVAACHPAMTVPAGSADPDLLVGTAWAVTAAPADLGWARDLVVDLGGDPYDVPDDRRVLYHAGLAVASNAVGAGVAVARQLLLAARIGDPAPFLAPLVHASITNVLAAGASALTGPVTRGDTGTILRHLAEVAADVPTLLASYRALTAVVLDQARPALSAAQIASLEAVLEGVGPEAHAAPGAPGAPGPPTLDASGPRPDEGGGPPCDG